MKPPDNLLEQIRLAFPAKERDIRTVSPLKLAYLGDAVFEIIVRTYVFDSIGGPPKNLHRKTSSLVNARSQAAMADVIRPHLTEEEESFFRRGRNAKPSTVAKNADIADYHTATGLEALYGYLYLTGRMERAIELIQLAYKTFANGEQNE